MDRAKIIEEYKKRFVQIEVELRKAKRVTALIKTEKIRKKLEITIEKSEVENKKLRTAMADIESCWQAEAKAKVKSKAEAKIEAEANHRCHRRTSFVPSR